MSVKDSIINLQKQRKQQAADKIAKLPKKPLIPKKQVDPQQDIIKYINKIDPKNPKKSNLENTKLGKILATKKQEKIKIPVSLIIIEIISIVTGFMILGASHASMYMLADTTTQVAIARGIQPLASQATALKEFVGVIAGSLVIGFLNWKLLYILCSLVKGLFK